jgi:hypothetical protein
VFCTPPLSLGLAVAKEVKKLNPKESCGGVWGRWAPQLSFGFAAIKVNFVNFFDEDLTFEKWDSAKL